MWDKKKRIRLTYNMGLESGLRSGYLHLEFVFFVYKCFSSNSHNVPNETGKF